MAKLNRKSTSKMNCKSTNDKKRSSSYFKRPQKLKASQQIRKESSNNGSYHSGTRSLSVLLCDPGHSVECRSQVKNDNHLQCSSELDLSSMKDLVDPVVDSYECITIEDDSTHKSSELKDVSQECHKQFYPHLSTSLNQQCDILSEHDELSQNMISIKIGFEKDIKILQNGIQSHNNHGRHNQINSNFYFNAIKRLNNENSYIKQLLQEKEELDKEFKNVKKRLNRKCDLIVHKISLVQSVYCTINKLFKFSMHQRKVILSTVGWMKNIKKKLSRRNRKVIDIPTDDDTTFIPEEYIVNKPHMRYPQIETENRKVIDIPTDDDTTFIPEEYIVSKPHMQYQQIEEDVSTNISFIPQEVSVNQPREEMVFDDNIINFEVVHPEIKEEKLISDNPSLIDLRNQELCEAKEKALMLLEELKSTQDELQKVNNEMNEQVSSIEQNADCEQQKMKVQLSEIRAMLKEKMGSTTKISNILENNSNAVTCQSILWDIRWLVEESLHFKVNTQNITDTTITSDGLKVTENEVHLLILIAFFLKVIPFSVTTEFIHTYLKNIDSSISLQFVTSLLNKFPTVFKGESVGAGSLEKKWRHLSLIPVVTI